MEKVVWKYSLTSEVTRVGMPRCARVLCVQLQHDQPTLWALVDPNEQVRDTRLFAIRGTGQSWSSRTPIDNEVYIGTVQLPGGSVVYHVFEVYG